jgi:hypothetical protein
VRVFTPEEVSRHSGSKYLGVLVASRYGRELNALPRDAVPAGLEKKLTTRALEAFVNRSVDYTLTKRRRKGV